MDHVLQLNEFFVEGGKQELSHVLLHITEPSTPEEMSKGYFFAICEINQAETKYITKLQEIIDEAENNYYETPDEVGKTSLEIILEKINQHAYALVRPGVTLNCVIGAIRQPEIIFTFFGKPQMVLFYKNRQGLYQKMDLINANAEETEKDDSPQLFSQIVQGKISPNDYLFAGTPHITNYFSHDRLEKIITSKPAAESAQHIERVLGELKGGYSFGGMIMQIRQPDENEVVKKAPFPIQRGDSAKSLNSLFNRERNTASTLSPSFLPRFNGGSFKSLFEPKPTEAVVPEIKKPIFPTAQINSAHVNAHRVRPNTESYLTTEKLRAFLGLAVRYTKAIIQGLWWILLFLISILHSLFRGAIMLFFVISNYQHRRKTILEDWKRQWRGYKENVKRLPAVTKIMLLASVALGIFFIGSILYLRVQQKQAVATQAFQDGVKTIREKKDAMESALIYKNEAAALADLVLAKNILADLRCTTKDQKTACTTLGNELAELTTRIRKLTTTIPELLVDWGAIFQIRPENLIKVKSKLIAFSSTSSTLVIYDLLTKESRIMPTSISSKGFNEAATPKENDYALFLSNSRDLISLNPDDSSIKNIDVAYPNENVNIQSMVVYNRRLYSLDILNNKIYKHDTIKTGFSRGKEWAQNTGNALENGEDITIDGDVFVITKTGQIAKFTAGAYQPFPIEGLDPALGPGGKIWTYTDIDYIYVLDGKNKRLLILQKDGRLKQQLTAIEFKNPSGMVIDPAASTAYILDTSKLFKITLK